MVVLNAANGIGVTYWNFDHWFHSAEHIDEFGHGWPDSATATGALRSQSTLTGIRTCANWGQTRSIGRYGVKT